MAYMEALRDLAMALVRFIQGRRQTLIESAAHEVDVICDLFERRPISRLIIRQASIRRVNAEGKKPVEGWGEWRKLKELAAQQVPIKGFEVTQVKDDSVALGDRLDRKAPRGGLWQTSSSSTSACTRESLPSRDSSDWTAVTAAPIRGSPTLDARSQEPDAAQGRSYHRKKVKSCLVFWRRKVNRLVFSARE